MMLSDCKLKEMKRETQFYQSQNYLLRLFLSINF